MHPLWRAISAQTAKIPSDPRSGIDTFFPARYNEKYKSAR